MRENSAAERLYNGILKENPTFVLMLGMCPTLAVTTSAINGLGMGLTTAVVLALSNLIISLLRKIIPDKVRIPAFIVIIASFVTIVQLLLEAYLPSLNEALGVYIPLIVVNCIILGRAEAYAYFNGPVASLFDGIGMGLGFSLALTCIGGVREILGTGKLFDIQIMPDSFTPIGIFVLAPGAFFVLAVLTAIQNFIKIQGEKRGKDMSKIGSGCSHDCMNCTVGSCADRVEEKAEEKAEENAEEKASEAAVAVMATAVEATTEKEPKEQAASGEKTEKKQTAKKTSGGRKKKTAEVAAEAVENVQEAAEQVKETTEQVKETVATVIADGESTEKKTATKKATAKKTTVKKPVTKKSAEKEPIEKDAVEKETAEKETTEKESTVKKPAAKKPAEKKPTAKKTATKKPAVKKAEPAPKADSDSLEMIDLDKEEN